MLCQAGLQAKYAVMAMPSCVSHFGKGFSAPPNKQTRPLLTDPHPAACPSSAALLTAGKETVNTLYGTRVAVLAGDFLFAQSSWLIANLENMEVRWCWPQQQ